MTSIENRLLRQLGEAAAHRKVDDVRIGLGYTAVQLDNGGTGLAWTPPREGTGCTHIHRQEPLTGSQAAKLLDFLGEKDPLYRALGLATVNALLADHAHPTCTTDALDLLDIRSSDRVTMVGFFGPLIPRIRQTGCRLDIIERNRDYQQTIAPADGDEALAYCDIAIVTATSLINGTLNRVLDALGKPRKAVLLGPSAPLCAEAFKETVFTQISGSRVINAAATLQTVSEGGGTPQLKAHVAFETIMIN